MAQNKNKENILNDAFSSIKGYFLYAVLFSASVNLLMLTPVIYMLQVYDRVVSSGSMSTLMMLTLLMMLLLSSSGSFEWVRSRLLVAANVRLESSLRDPLSKAGFTATLVSGNPNGASQTMSDLLALRQFITGSGAFAVMDAPWTLFYIGIMFIFHPMFGIAAIISAVIMILLAVITQKATSEKLLNANQLTAKANMSFRSNLKNAEVIHGMGMAANIRRRDNALYDAASDEQAVASTIAGRLSAISKSFRMISQSILLGMGAYLALNGEISPGLMIAGSLLLGRALAPIDLIVGNWKGFVEVKSQYNRIRDTLAAFPAENDRMELPAPNGSLSVEQIILIPPGAQVASLKGVSFQLDAGDALGIIGPSAAGKTSLARAILGVWPLRAGTVRLDGAEITQWDRDELGPYLGYLPQDIELFDGSIADNICRFSQQDSAKIIEASQTAGIHEMILHLPEGYDTMLNSNAGALSAGQRQRVGLARAIYGQPRLVILDEPNSNLDDQGERDLLAALQRMKESGHTVIVITHRTSILSMVDKLLVMKDGDIMKFGEKDEVLRAINTSTAKIAQLQNKA
jgi:ATP-binding cassette subfamily C protein EexD